MTRTYDIAIIGGGIAGAAILHHLAQRGARASVLVEREILPGMHASGRNAAMIRQNVPDALQRLLARRSVQFYRCPAESGEEVEFRVVGSLLLGGAAPEAADELLDEPLEIEEWSPAQALERVPILRRETITRAEYCPGDGVIDVHALLQLYLRGALRAGCELRLGEEARAIHRTAQGGFAITTTRGELEAEVLIDAAGAWCQGIAALSGSSIGAAMQPHCRHLFVTSPLACVDPHWPFTWDLENDFYFRPESGGILFCACDEAPAEPGLPLTSPAVEDMALEKIAAFLPALLESSFAYRWAGLRTLPADGHFTVGADPQVPGLIWAGGLGGHGVTASYEVGRLVANAALGREEPADAPLYAAMAPGRWLGERTGGGGTRL